MLDQVRAIYREGAFHPVVPCNLPNDLQVELIIQPVAPLATDPDERRRALEALTERMKQRSLAADAPRLTRDQMHERR